MPVLYIVCRISTSLSLKITPPGSLPVSTACSKRQANRKYGKHDYVKLLRKNVRNEIFRCCLPMWDFYISTANLLTDLNTYLLKLFFGLSSINRILSIYTIQFTRVSARVCVSYRDKSSLYDAFLKNQNISIKNVIEIGAAVSRENVTGR